MPFSSQSRLSFFSCVSLLFSTTSSSLERDLDVLAIDILKSLERSKDWEYYPEMQVQALSQKLLYLYLREVTSGWQKQKISLEMVFPRMFLKFLFLP